MFDKDFIPTKPFPSFKWKWASYQCTEGINDPVVLLGVLSRMRQLEKRGLGLKYSSREFADAMRSLSADIADSVGVNLAGRTGERNLMRNSGQYWRALGLTPRINHSGVIELTDFGRMVADRTVSQSEFAATSIMTLTLPNANIQSSEECNLWHKHGLDFKPLLLILSILLELNTRGQGFLTPRELTDIVIPLSGCNAQVADHANFVCWTREGSVDPGKFPNCCIESNDKRMAREFLLFLANYGYVNKTSSTLNENERYSINGDIADEIIDITTNKLSNSSLIETAQKVRATSVTSEIERKRLSGRPRQAQFRREVLSRCKRCVITNVCMPEVLEAAHIKPYKYNGADTIANGLAMRTDIHLLFDTGHLRISERGDVVLSQTDRLDYGALIPPKIVVPDFTDRDNLRWRWENYNGY